MSTGSSAPTPPATAGSRKRERLSDEAMTGMTPASLSLKSDASGCSGVESGLNSDSGSVTERSSKKTHYQPQSVSVGDMEAHNSQTTIHLKVLIPSVAAGGIIGKGGETIAEMQKKTGVRFKMSKANEYYPGTTERVCLLTGSPDGISDVLDFICDKVRERPDPHARVAMDFDNKVCVERDKQLKIIIPNTTAGVIIGKGGNYIKRIKDESGAFVQISQKSKEATLPERVVTVIGDKAKNRDAMELIMDKIQEDPMSGSCLNINYSEVTGMVANFNPTGSPFANSNANTSMGSTSTSGNSSFGSDGTPTENGGVIGRANAVNGNQLILPLTTGGSLGLRFNMGVNRGPPDPAFLSQCLNVLRTTFRASGHSEAAIEEMVKSFHCLSSHGVLVFSNPSQTQHQQQQQQQPTPHQHHQQQHPHHPNSSSSSSVNVPSAAGAPSAAPTAAPTTLVVDTSQRHPLMESPFPSASAATTPTFINAAGHGSFIRGPEAFHTPHHDFANGSATNGAAAAAAGSPFAAFHNAQSSQFATSRYWSNSTNGDLRESSSNPLDPFVRQPPSPHHQQHQGVHHVQLHGQALLASNPAAAAATVSANGNSQNANSFGLGPNTGLAAAVAAGGLSSRSPVEHLRGVHDDGSNGEPTDKLELDINESIIGAIIGPNGRSISDIQQVSGARIQISKKGIYSPGTRNRIVTVSGTKGAIATARNMIEGRIGGEENKRVHERHSYQGGNGTGNGNGSHHHTNGAR